MSGVVRGVDVVWDDFVAGVREADLDGRAETGEAGARVVAGRLEARGVRMKNAGGAPRSWQADARTVAVDGHLDGRGSELRGPMRIALEGIAGQVGATRLAGDVQAALQVASGSAAALRLRGELQARNVLVATGAREVQNWWANLRVSDAEVHLGRDLDLHGAVQASLQNGLPALNLLTASDDLPSWMPAALPLERLSLVLDIERYCRLTDVRVREAKGGPLSARGRLQLEPGESRGAVLITLPAVVPVSVGFDFVQGETNTSTLVGDSWLSRHGDLMDQAWTAKRAALCRPAAQTCK